MVRHRQAHRPKGSRVPRGRYMRCRFTEQHATYVWKHNKWMHLNHSHEQTKPSVQEMPPTLVPIREITRPPGCERASPDGCVVLRRATPLSPLLLFLPLCPRHSQRLNSFCVLYPIGEARAPQLQTQSNRQQKLCSLRQLLLKSTPAAPFRSLSFPLFLARCDDSVQRFGATIRFDFATERW